MPLQFDLHQLGWYAFEQLCRTICREKWQAPVEAYSVGADGGRDGTLSGSLFGGERQRFVLQCKHVGTPTKHLALSDVDDEVPKASFHVAQGRCDVYLLMTNARLSGPAAAQIETAFRDVGVPTVHVLGYEALVETLTENKSLRAQVPRLYGLGDLTEILDERAYAQAQAILAAMHDDLARLVPVDAHQRAVDALRDERFVLLVGRPGSGKSSIAASLAIGAMDLYGVRPIHLLRPSDFLAHWNPHDPDQLFWLDDAFGTTQYDASAVDEWNRADRSIRSALAGGARMVVTSRDYIFEAAAASGLRGDSLPLLDGTKVVIRVESFTAEERRQILYNHLRLGRQPSAFLTALQPVWLERFAESPDFIPELARRVSDPFFTAPMGQRPTETLLLDFVARPLAYLLELITGLDPASRAAMGLVHLRGGRLESPYESRPGDEEFLERVGVDLGACLRTLSQLDKSLVRFVSAGDERWWQFHHPTFTDAYRAWLGDHPELLREYVASTPTLDLMRSVTCGDMGITGALILPASQHGTVIERLIAEEIQHSAWDARSSWERRLFSFLTHRVSGDFLSSYAEAAPGLVRSAFAVGLWLSAHDPQRDLARRLLDEGVAAETDRIDLVRQLTEFATTGQDGSFLADPRWLAFFTEDELAALDRQVRADLLPVIDDAMFDEVGNWDSDADVAGELEGSLAGYVERYGTSPELEAAIEYVRENAPSGHDYEPDEDWRSFREARDQSEAAERSIFDDLTSGR